MQSLGVSGETEVIGDNKDIVPEVIGESIAEYDVPFDQEGVDGTQRLHCSDDLPEGKYPPSQLHVPCRKGLRGGR